MNHPTALPLLVTPEELHALLSGAAPPVVLDCGFDLGDTAAGERAWQQARVPGALYAHLDRELAGPKTGRNGRHPLPAREALADTLARWGITPQRRVVTYDRQGAPYAARAWWLLRWMGVAEVAVLDGGWQAWVAAGLPQDTGAAVPMAAAPAPWPAPALPTVEAAELLAGLGRVAVIDARAGERFRGEKEPLDPVAGHIPGAINRPFTGNLGPEGFFAPAHELRGAFKALLGDLPADAVVHQCGSGVTACHNLLAMEVAGLPGSKLYPGSWSEWCADPARPVARS
jgi:thiosulfate/3-mercaptopyruvate sulfurtransferase